MLELPSPNRLTRIQSSDHILKHVFAGSFVYVEYLCFDFGFQFVYCGWLFEVHTIFQVCPQKEVRQSQIGTSHWPLVLFSIIGEWLKRTVKSKTLSCLLYYFNLENFAILRILFVQSSLVRVMSF